MQKYLFWYAWIFAALIIGILICLGLLAYMLFFRSEPQAVFYPGAQLVREAMFYAAI